MTRPAGTAMTTLPTRTAATNVRRRAEVTAARAALGTTATRRGPTFGTATIGVTATAMTSARRQTFGQARIERGAAVGLDRSLGGLAGAEGREARPDGDA